MVLAIEDENLVDVSKEFLNVVMDKLDASLTDDQKLAFLEIAGNIKCGHLKMMTVEFEAVETISAPNTCPVVIVTLFV